MVAPMNRIKREKTEAKVFDEQIHVEYAKIKEKDLLFPKGNLRYHLDLSSPPLMSYRYAIFLLNDCEIKDQTILNIACGSGYESIILAYKGANIKAFDISPLSVRLAERRALVNELSHKIHTEIMSVYNMRFADKTFKYVYGNACLHHFDLEVAIKEIYRVLKPNGFAVFHEPFGASKALQTIRNFIPIEKQVVSPDERQLTYADIRTIKRTFNTVIVKEFGLFSRLTRLIKKECINEMLYKIDSILLDNIPFLRRYAQSIVIKAIK